MDLIRSSRLAKIVDTCKERIEAKERLVSVLMVGGPGHRGRAIVFLFRPSSHTPEFVVKIALTEEESQYLTREFVALENVRPILSNTLRGRVPEPLALFQAEESTALLCKALIGQRLLVPKLMSKRKPIGCNVVRQFFQQAFDFSLDLASARPVNGFSSSLPEVVSEFRDRFGGHGETGRELGAFEHEVLDARIASRPTWQHCDMMMSNVLQDGGELRILDWEHSRANSHAWFDIAYAPVALVLMSSWQTGVKFPIAMMQVLNRASWPGRIISEEMERVWRFSLPLSWGVLLTAMETALRQEDEGRKASGEWAGFVHMILGKRAKQELPWLSRW